MALNLITAAIFLSYFKPSKCRYCCELLQYFYNPSTWNSRFNGELSWNSQFLFQTSCNHYCSSEASLCFSLHVADKEVSRLLVEKHLADRLLANSTQLRVTSAFGQKLNFEKSLFMRCVCTKCHSAKCHSAQCQAAKCHAAKCHAAKCHVAKCHAAKCHAIKCHAANCPLAKCPSAKCPSAKWQSAKWRGVGKESLL